MVSMSSYRGYLTGTNNCCFIEDEERPRLTARGTLISADMVDCRVRVLLCLKVEKGTREMRSLKKIEKQEEQNVKKEANMA